LKNKAETLKYTKKKTFLNTHFRILNVNKKRSETLNVVSHASDYSQSQGAKRSQLPPSSPLSITTKFTAPQIVFLSNFFWLRHSVINL